MRLAIIDQPYCNRGDESAHKAFVRQLVKSFPDSRIDVFFRISNTNVKDDMDVHLQNVRYLNLNLGRYFWPIIKYSYYTHTTFLSYIYSPLCRFRKLLKKYDIIIGAPGGMNMGGFCDWLHLWFFETARRLNKPTLYWGRSIGPFSEDDYQSKLFKKHSVKLLNYFSFIGLRDSISAKCANELAIGAEEIVDSAFLECPNVIVPRNILQEIGGNDYVVYVPNELTWHPRYSKSEQSQIDKFFLKIIDLISDKYPNRKIVMLPQTYKSRIDDYSYFKRLCNLSKNKNIIIIDENQSSDIQQKIISGSKLVIGARYHSIVFAINNNVPFISLSYEHKMKGLLDKLGLTENMVDIQGVFNNEDKYLSALRNIEKLLLTKEQHINRNIANEIVSKGFDKMVVALKQLDNK